MNLLTFTPIKTNFLLKTGITPFTNAYFDIICHLDDQPENVSLFNVNNTNELAYAELHRDSVDLRFLVWEKPEEEGQNFKVRIHIYPNSVGMVEITFFDVEAKSAAELETWSQEQSVEIIEQAYPALEQYLHRLKEQIPSQYLQKLSTEVDFLTRGEIVERISRMILLSEDERKTPKFQKILKDWLANTIDPSDGEKIAKSQTNASMTWVNYVVVDKDEAETNRNISTMRIAQYFWSAQEWFNIEAQNVITDSLLEKRVKQTEGKLKDIRARMQMLEIEHNALRAVLNRQKDSLLAEILEGWGYLKLTKNGELLGDLAEQKINEISRKHARRQSLLTDMILGGIGFLAIVEVFLYLHEFSRQVMSRPALGYNDDSASLILSFIARINTDYTLTIGFASLLTLILIYYILRKER